MQPTKWMMVLVAIASLIAPPCYAEWAVSYGTSYSNTAYSIQQTNDNGYVVAGGFGFWVLKLNCDGSVSWQKEFSLDPFDEAQAVQQTQDDGYILAGVSSHHYADEVWVLKLRPDGSLDWQKTYGGSGSYDRAYSIQETVDQAGNADGYVVAGSTIHQIGASWDIWVLKLNLDGSVSWQKTYNLHTDGGYAIRQTFNQQGDPDGYIVAGSTGYYGSGVWVLRLDPDGAVNWHKIYTAGGATSARSILQAFDQQGQPEGYIVAGTVDTDAWVLKLNPDGSVNWQNAYGGAGLDIARAVGQTQDGGYILAGKTASFDAGGNDVWLLKLTSAGSIQWERTYGGSSDDGAHDVRPTRDGGYILAGYTWSFGGSPDMWVLKLNEQGEIPACSAMGTSAAAVSTPTITLFDTPAPTVLSSDAAIAVPEVTTSEPYYNLSVVCFYSMTDSDVDGLPDELEKSTGTDPCDDDTDNDGLIDGPGSGEDTNRNGTVDPGETDPRLVDTDGDGIPDGIEKGLTEPEGRDTDMDTFAPDADPFTTTDPTDADSDEDGILDGNEDQNRDGLYDPSQGETSPNDPDSDGDGIFDGTENGLTAPQDPDATDLSSGFFVPDADPQKTTDATDADSDDDGFPDGLEDGNQNGAVDPWEPDPANARSYPAAVIHLNQGFNLIALHAQGELGDWLPALGDSAQIQAVMAYDTQAGAYVTLSPDEASPASFVLQGGEALMVYAKTQRDIALVGVQCPSFELTSGLNLVGIACRAESYSAFEFLSDLGSESIASIQRYSTEKGAFETAGFSPEGQPEGIDFQIMPGEGYFVFMRQAVGPLDSDGDGLLDDQEPGHGTLPDNPDSDGDGLLDGLEVNIYGTNPTLLDTDEDDFDDGLEVAWGSNPLDNTSTPIPPDPTTVAPVLDQTVATTMAAAAEFLYTGDYPIQWGMDPATIDPKRAAVLRGKALDRNGSPLSGVVIIIHGHPEYGYTFSREDGMFDMAVNGGGLLTINYRKEGYFTAQRQVDIPLKDYARLPDVVMSQADPVVTDIDLTDTVPIQVAQSSVITDDDGTRQATLLFPQGNQAEMVMPDGSTQPISNLSVRATEYTVGPNGPEAMPAKLPSNSGYTYAVELSLDEALAAGAKDVQFSEPVFYYVENFLDFPIGMTVPTGYYDRQKGQWIPSQNGKVIKVLSITGDMADLDVDGDGLADVGAVLSDLGVTNEERTQLALLYAPGQSLWRVPINHFSPWDCNWPFGPPEEAKPPKQKKPKKTEKEDEFTIECQSIVECQNQILGESIPITGTPFSLDYRSDRNADYRAGYLLEIQLTDDNLPDGLLGVSVEVRVAGQLFASNFDPAPDLSFEYEWDGKDVYGRHVQGEQTATVRIGYVYEGVYQEPAERSASFAQFSGIPVTGNLTRQEITIWQEFQETIGNFLTSNYGFMGWTLDAHHFYNLNSLVLNKGNGQRRRAATLNAVINTARNMDDIFDSLPSERRSPDDGFYIPDDQYYQVYKYKRDGSVIEVAGNLTPGFSGDGGPAIAAQLNTPYDAIPAPDGGFYIADTGNYRIRRVGPDGIINTIAGNGTYDSTGDGGPAISASIALHVYSMLLLAPDGSLYFTELETYRVRRIGTDGIITTVAGNGTYGFSGDGGPASLAQLTWPTGMAMGLYGSLYIADNESHRIRQVGPDGIITTVAGNGNGGFSGDGGPATLAQLAYPTGVAVGPDGSLYIADAANARIRKVGTDGVINTLAGDGTPGYDGDGGPATAANIYALEIAAGPDGAILIAYDFFDDFPDAIRRIGPQLPDFQLEEIVIPAADGSEIYVFDNQGRHLRTLNGLTGALKYQFSYFVGSLLINRIEDGDGNVTTIERDGESGPPTAIIGPYGHRTILERNNEGLLARITNPAGESYQFSYDVNRPDGDLLTELTDPRGNTSLFTYDAKGFLARDENAAGGSLDLTRTDITDGYEVTTESALGRLTTYRVGKLSTGEKRKSITSPNGLQKTAVIDTDGTIETTYTDGMVIRTENGPDPRFGMHVQIPSRMLLNTSGGIASMIETDLTVTLLDPLNLLSLDTLTRTKQINGRTYTVSFDSNTGEQTMTTPEGRKTLITRDGQERAVGFQAEGLASITYAYDAKGRLQTVTRGTGEDARIATFQYNASDGYMESLSDAESYTTALGRDSATGRVNTLSLPDGGQILLNYDANGNTVSLAPPGRSAHTFTYTRNNLLESYTPPSAGPGTGPIQYEYNGDKQLELVTRPDGKLIDYQYNAGTGRLDKIAVFEGGVETGAITYVYNPPSSGAAGKVASINAVDGTSLGLTYDSFLLTGTTWGGTINGSVQHTYNNDLWTTSESVNSAETVNFVYDLDGLIMQAGSMILTRDDPAIPETQNGLLRGVELLNTTTALDYNAFGELKDFETVFDDGTGAVTLFEAHYVRDKLGRIKEKTETVDGNTVQFTYEYDGGRRLWRVSRDDVLARTYTYDQNGNRLIFDDQGVLDVEYDEQDRLNRYGQKTYTYVATGEWATRTDSSGTTTYQYDVFRNLRKVTLPDGTEIEYVIDSRHRRVGKKVNGNLMQGLLYRDLYKPVAELDGAGNVVSRFIYGTRWIVPAYLMKGGVTYRIISDHLGSPRAVTNAATGVVVQRMDYDEFGNITLDTNPGFQPFGFAGGLYDPDTGLTRFGSRDYDPETGRWTAKDPFLFQGNANRYVYVLNDPVNFVDLTGNAERGAEFWNSYRKTMVKVDGKWLDQNTTPYETEVSMNKLCPQCPPTDEPEAVIWVDEEGNLHDMMISDDGAKGNEKTAYYEKDLGTEDAWDSESNKSTGPRDHRKHVNEQIAAEQNQTSPGAGGGGGAGGGAGFCKYNIWRDSSGNIINVVKTPW